MIAVNGKILAEKNDINTVLSEGELFEDVLCVSQGDKKITSFDPTLGNLLLISNGNGSVIGIPMKSNSYLRIDVNGNIMFKGE